MFEIVTLLWTCFVLGFTVACMLYAPNRWSAADIILIWFAVETFVVGAFTLRKKT
jgi:hypothetical protein